MSLMSDIEKEINSKNIPKWRILKESAGEEIEKMIDAAIPITKQVDLLLKHGIVEKLDRKEYTKIITKYFGYLPSTKKRKKEKSNTVVTNSIYKGKNETSRAVTTQKKTATDMLSEDVDLMGSFLKKKSKG